MPRNPFRKPTERAAEKALVEAFSQEAREKMTDELPPEPTFADQLAKAGGKSVSVPSAADVADWHDLDA